MNSLSNGHGPQGKESDPKRRKNKRRRTRRPGSKPVKDTGEMVPDVLENFAATNSGGSGETSVDSRSNSEAAFAARSATRNQQSKSQNGKKPANRSGARWHGKKKKNSSFNQLRNLRAVPEKDPTPTFQEAPKEEKQNRRHNQHRRGRNRKRFYAALDLGTNNCRLLVALPQERGHFRVVDGFSRIVRLGEGLAQTGSLNADAMDRAIAALKICSGKLGNAGIRRQRLIATEACRRADNGEEFLERVHIETGLKLEIVDRETEARLAAEGCGSLLDRKSDGAVLFDIGGGSSEVILVENPRQKRRMISERILAWTSLPLGVVTLAEQFGGRDVSRVLFKDMVEHVKDQIGGFENSGAFEPIMKNGKVHLLGTSGTVTTLAGIHLKLNRYDRRKVDGIWLDSNEIDDVINNLLTMTYEERAQNPCIGKERADLVLAGCAILEAIRAIWPAQRLRVADRGLREGLLAEMINRDRAWLRRSGKHWNRKPYSRNKRQQGNRPQS